MNYSKTRSVLAITPMLLFIWFLFKSPAKLQLLISSKTPIHIYYAFIHQRRFYRENCVQLFSTQPDKLLYNLACKMQICTWFSWLSSGFFYIETQDDHDDDPVAALLLVLMLTSAERNKMELLVEQEVVKMLFAVHILCSSWIQISSKISNKKICSGLPMLDCFDRSD